MKIINTSAKREIVEALRLDICLAITKGNLQPLGEITRILDLYVWQGFVGRYENLYVSPDEVSVVVYCPGRVEIRIKVP